MSTATKYDHARKRIEMMLEEIKLLAIDAEEIVRESTAFHELNFSNFDILDRDERLAERAASDKVVDAQSLCGTVSQLRSNLESEVRKLRERTAFGKSASGECAAPSDPALMPGERHTA